VFGRFEGVWKDPEKPGPEHVGGYGKYEYISIKVPKISM